MNSSLAALTNKLTKRKPSKVLIHLSLEKGRDNGLLVLTEKFIELIKKREDYTIDLNEAANILKVRKRRIYDITNVLEGINYIEKPQKNTVKWIAGNESPESENEIDEIKQKHEELTEQQKRLDQSIEQLNKQIKTEFLQNQELRQYHYITYENCLKIYNAMNKNDQTKSLIILSAPKGTQIESKSLIEGSQLTMDSKGKGPIKVYVCLRNTGVKELWPSRDEEEWQSQDDQNSFEEDLKQVFGLGKNKEYVDGLVGLNTKDRKNWKRDHNRQFLEDEESSSGESSSSESEESSSSDESNEQGSPSKPRQQKQTEKPREEQTEQAPQFLEGIKGRKMNLNGMQESESIVSDASFILDQNVEDTFRDMFRDMTARIAGMQIGQCLDEADISYELPNNEQSFASQWARDEADISYELQNNEQSVVSSASSRSYRLSKNMPDRSQPVNDRSFARKHWSYAQYIEEQQKNQEHMRKQDKEIVIVIDEVSPLVFEKDVKVNQRLFRPKTILTTTSKEDLLRQLDNIESLIEFNANQSQKKMKLKTIFPVYGVLKNQPFRSRQGHINDDDRDSGSDTVKEGVMRIKNQLQVALAKRK